MFVARQSNHINEDLKRQWSSWNFGQDGFEGTFDELQAYLASADDSFPAQVSMFEIYPGQQSQFEFGELYPNYWVVKDTRFQGVAVNALPFSNLQDCINFMNTNPSFCGGDGDKVDTSSARLVWSSDDLHILEIED